MAFFLLFLILIILFFIYVFLTYFKPLETPQKTPEKKQLSKLLNCPICHADITQKKLYSRLLELPDKKQILQITGCAECKNSASGQKRCCPSCKSTLNTSEYVIASYEKRQEKDKVVIKGCRHCYRLPVQ